MTEIEQSTKYICKICKYETNVKWCLVNHLQRKKACGTSTEFTRETLLKELTEKEYNDITFNCKYCEKKFNDRSNSYKHMKVCKQRPSTSTTPVETTPTSPQETTQATTSTAQNIDITQVCSAIPIEVYNHIRDSIKKDIMQELALASNNQVNINTFNIINTQNNTQNNIIKSFGSEDTSHLSHDFLSHCLMNPTKGITNLIDSIHYSTDVPSNHNVRFKSNKKNTFEKYTDEHWMECDATNTLDELIRKGYKVLNAHYMEHFMNDPSILENEMKQRAMERFRFLGDKKSNDYLSVRRDLRCLVKDRTMYILELSKDATSSDMNTILPNDILDN